MTKIPTSHIAWIAFALVVLMVLGSLFMHPGGRLTDLSGKIFSPVSAALHRGIAFIGVFANRRDLVMENAHLTDQLHQAQRDQAQLDALVQENAFLKAAINLKDRLAKGPIEGGVFAYLSEGGVRQVMINRGTQDGVQVGSVVITAQGALVGTVQEVSFRHASVRTLADASMEVTARIVGSEVTGLVRVDANQGLLFDLVQKSEHVTEGQLVATSGNDQIPAGLIIGKVRSVDMTSVTLFATVRIDSLMGDRPSGKVLILP